MENQGNTYITIQKEEFEEIKNELKSISLSIKQLEHSILDPIKVQEMVEIIIDNLETSGVDCVDYDSANMEMSYDNRIELTNIDIDLSGLAEELASTINNEFFGKTIS